MRNKVSMYLLSALLAQAAQASVEKLEMPVERKSIEPDDLKLNSKVSRGPQRKINRGRK